QGPRHRPQKMPPIVTTPPPPSTAFAPTHIWWLPESNRWMCGTRTPMRAPAASVTQGRHVPGERMNARYVAVALVAAIIDECPEKNESVASVSEIEGDLSAPPYCASRAACALYAIGRG